MAKNVTDKLKIIDEKVEKINSKRFPPIVYETYIEYRLTKLAEKRASLSAEIDEQSQERA